MSKIILILGILLATSYFGDTDNLPSSRTKIGKNVWFPAIPADSAVSKDTVDTNSRDKRSMAVVLPVASIHADGNNNDDVKDDEDDDDDDKEMNRKNYKTKRCRGLPSYRKIKLRKGPEEDVASYAIKNARSLDNLDPSKNIILQMGKDNQVSSEETEEEEQPYLRIAAVKNPKAILKNILRSKSMQRYEESDINKDNAILKRVKTHLRPEECEVLALIGKRAGNIRPNKPRKFVCYYDDNNCGNNPGQMVLQAYPMWKKARPVLLKENNYGINTIPVVQQNHQFQKFAQAPTLTQYSQPSVLAKSQNPIAGSQIISGTLKIQNGAVPMDTRSGAQKQQFENIKNPPVLQLPEQPLNIQYGVPSDKINWQQLNKMASADSAIQRNGFVGQQIKSHASVQMPFRQDCVGTSYSGNNAIDQINEKMLNQQDSIDHKIEDEYLGIEQTIPRGNEKSWSIGRTELGKSFRNVEDCIKLYGREFCVVNAKSLSQWKNDAVHQIGLDSEDGHLSTDYSDRNTLNYGSTPVSANYGYQNDEHTVESNYQYDSRNPYTELKYTSEQPLVAQTGQNKILTGSEKSYETFATNFGYSADHNEKQIVGSKYQYDSRNPNMELKYTSEQPFVAQRAQNKIIKESDESYEPVTTNIGYSTHHNEEQALGSNYQYDSMNPDAQLKYTSEKPFVAQTARNKLLTGSDESYEPVTTNFEYSTHHNEEQAVGSNYQYDSRNPETQLNYISEQPFVAQAAQNKILPGSAKSYEAVTTDFGYSPENNFNGQTLNYNVENNSKQRVQEDHVQQNIDTSDYYDNTGSQNSHIYQYEDNSVHNNNMKYNDQSLSHDTYGTYDTYGYATEKYLLSQKQKPNLYSDSRHPIVDDPSYRVPVTPYENDNSFYTTENNLQHYNDYSSDDKNDLKYPVISGDTRESNYADNTEPYTGNRYYNVQPEYYTMNKMLKMIQHGACIQPPVIIGTENPSLSQIEPAISEHSTYPENTIKRPLGITNNHYEQVQLSEPSYEHIPSHDYTNINYFNEQLNNHQLGKAYTAQHFDNTDYIKNNYNFNNYPNFYDTREKNIWENSERILSPHGRNEHIASSNMLREMSEGVQEHQSPGPEWDSERFSSVDNSKESTATDHSQIIEVTNGYSFVDNNFDKANGMHTNDPTSSTDLFINDRNDRFTPKFTDINDSQIERQPQDILGHVASTNFLEKFADSTGNVLKSVEFQTDGPGDIRYIGDSVKHLDEIENSATEVTYAESTETPYGEGDSVRDQGEKYSPSISVDLTSPHSRKCFIAETGEEGSSTPLRDLVGQSLHEGSMEQSAETYTVGNKDLDLKNAEKIKSKIHATEVNSNPSIDLPTDRESIIRDIVGEYFDEGIRDKNTDSHDILKSVTQNSDMVNLTPTENFQSKISGPEDKLITSINLPKDIELTSTSDIIGKPLDKKILKEHTDSYDALESVTSNIETADTAMIGKSSEDNKYIVESDKRVIEPAMIGNSKSSVINNDKMFTTQDQEYSPDDKNYLKAAIMSVINNFAKNPENDMVGGSKNSKSIESSNSEDLLPEIISTPMLKTLFALPEVENTLTDMVKDTLSKSPYETKYRSILGSESDAIKSILRDVIAGIENSLPTDYPITVEEHEFKEGHWVTEQVTLLPTVPAEQRVQIPFSETVSKIILQTLKNVVTSPILGSKAASRPVVQNVIMETIKNALRKANVNTESIDDSALREVLDKLIQEMKAGVTLATGSLTDSFDSSASILGQSIDENTKISLAEDNSEFKKWTTTDNIQTQIEDPENLNSKEIFENNDKVVLLTSTDNYDEKSSILGQTVDMSDYDIRKESLLNDKKIFNHFPSTKPGINDAFSSSGESIIMNDEKESQTAAESEDYKILGEFNKEKCHCVSSEPSDGSPLKSVQSQIVDNTQVDDSVEENVQAAHSISSDNDYSLKSSQGSNFDNIQIDESMQNVQAAHSNPILSSSLISKCNNVSPDRMISHTPPEDISASSEEIIDHTLTVTEYPNLAFDNENTEHILGLTEKLPSDEDFSLKSSQGSNFDKIQIDKSIQENVQAIHSNPILSSPMIRKCNNVSPDRMISHTTPEDISASSEEIIDHTFTVTEYPNLAFDNEDTEHILGMTEILPAKNYNEVTSISSTDLSNNSPAVAIKPIEKVSSNPEVTDINNLLENGPIKYYSPNDRILEYKKNHLQYWNTESMTNTPLGNDMVKESIRRPDQGCTYSTIRKNSNDYYDNTDIMKKINSLQYNNNKIQKNEYMIGNDREIVTRDKDKKVNQEMIKSKTSSAILESTMNIMPNSKIDDYDDTESQTENNLEQFTSDGIVGLAEPQDAIEGSKKKYMDINPDESETEDISNDEYISNISEKNIQSDSSFENTQEKSMFDESVVNTSLDKETFSDIEDDSKLTATQEENAFFETTVNPLSDEETFVQPEQYDESEMAPDISEEEKSRSKEHVELAKPRENEKFLEKIYDNEEVSDVNMSEMTKDVSDEEISESEEHANLAESEKSEKSWETSIDSKGLNDLDNVSYDTEETAENLDMANSPIFDNDDYDLAKSQEVSSKIENAQGEAYKKNLKHNLENSDSKYLGASKSSTGSMKNIQVGKCTQMGIPDLESSNKNKMLKQTRTKEKLIPTKSHEIITKTIKKTITKTTKKYYGAEDSIEDTTVNSPNNEIVSATKSSCFQNSDHDLTYFGKLLPKCGRTEGNDISELTNSDLYYIGDGVRLPLTIKKLDDGSYGLSISEKVCEHFMNTRCPCCVPRDGTIVSEKRNSQEGRNLKRDLRKLSEKFFVEGERDSNEKVQDEVGKLKTRHTRSTPAVVSGIQNNEIIIPESHSTSSKSMPVQAFAEKYNLILDLTKHSVTENDEKTVTESDNNKSILNNDKGIEHEQKKDLTEIEENLLKILNETNRNKIFDENQTSNLVKSLIAINDAPESKRAGIVINALTNLIKMGPTEIYTVVDGQEKKLEILNTEHVEEDANATQDEEIAKYGYQKDNPILDRIKFIKAKQKEQSQHKYQQIDDDDVADKMEILKVILYWLKDVVLRIPAQNKS